VRRIQWSATQLPPLEQSGELQRALAKACDAKLGCDEYKWGVAYLHGLGGVRCDAYEWFRWSARCGDAKGQSALGTLLASGEAGVVDESEALRWYEASAAGGCHSALLAIGVLRLKQAERGYASAGLRGESARRCRPCFQEGSGGGVGDAWVWLAHAEEKLATHHAQQAARIGENDPRALNKGGGGTAMVARPAAGGGEGGKDSAAGEGGEGGRGGGGGVRCMPKLQLRALQKAHSGWRIR